MLRRHSPGTTVGFCAGLLVFSLLSQRASGQVDRAAWVRGLNNELLPLLGEASQIAPFQAGAPRSQAAQVIGQRTVALRAVVEQDPRAARSLMSRAHEPVARVRPKSNSGGLQ